MDWTDAYSCSNIEGWTRGERLCNTTLLLYLTCGYFVSCCFGNAARRYVTLISEMLNSRQQLYHSRLVCHATVFILRVRALPT